MRPLSTVQQNLPSRPPTSSPLHPRGSSEGTVGGNVDWFFCMQEDGEDAYLSSRLLSSAPNRLRFVESKVSFPLRTQRITWVAAAAAASGLCLL